LVGQQTGRFLSARFFQAFHYASFPSKKQEKNAFGTVPTQRIDFFGLTNSCLVGKFRIEIKRGKATKHKLKTAPTIWASERLVL
jgi:hypothetical protein